MIKQPRFLLLSLLISILAASIVVAQDAEVHALVYQTVNVRSGPGTQFEIVGQLNADDEVLVKGRDSHRTRWLQVAMPESVDSGWIASFTVIVQGDVDSLPIVAAESPDSVPAQGPSIVSYGRVNVRGGPGVEYDIIGQLEVDGEAVIGARSNYNNDWLYIENDDLSGWVAYFTVNVLGSLDDTPVRVPDDATGELVPPSTLIRADFNIRLHSSPSFQSSILAVIPFETMVNPTGISPDGQWLYLTYEGDEGWAFARLFDLNDTQRAQIPTRRPSQR